MSSRLRSIAAQTASAKPYYQVSLSLTGIALIAFCFLPFSINVQDPWLELSRLAQGMLTPDLSQLSELPRAVLNTLSFALQGVVIAALLGFLFSLFYHLRWVRMLMAFIRAIHELFWALLFIQIIGITPLAGVLAIAIPYIGIFAKVYAELLEESQQDHPSVFRYLQPNQSRSDDSKAKTLERLSIAFYTKIPLTWHAIRNYTAYRLECGIRSSIVLGFIGLPTLGFELESTLKEGYYSQAALLLYCLFILIASLRFWVRPATLLLLLPISLIYLPPTAQIDLTLAWQFFSHDILPAPIRQAGELGAVDWPRFYNWGEMLFSEQILPGIKETLLLSQAALLVTGIMTLLSFPLISHLFFSKPTIGLGHIFLIILRSTPEYLLAFVGVIAFGPSALPAILALALHNGAIIAHLIGSFSNQLTLRADASTGLNRYFFEVLPRIYRQFLAFLLYRWEVIMRETAILGILGIQTLGFFIDSAFSEIRYDRAVILILVSALLNVFVDHLARWLRHRLHLHSEDKGI